VARRESQRAVGQLSVLGEHVVGVLERGKRLFGLRIEQPSSGRGAHAEAAALEELDPGAALERLQALGDSRLRQVQRVGGAMHARCLDGCDECRQVSGRQRIGVSSLCKSSLWHIPSLADLGLRSGLVTEPYRRVILLGIGCAEKSWYPRRGAVTMHVQPPEALFLASETGVTARTSSTNHEWPGQDALRLRD
jgi:hypothetical protein